jgi:hypothetical protein
MSCLHRDDYWAHARQATGADHEGLVLALRCVDNTLDRIASALERAYPEPDDATVALLTAASTYATIYEAEYEERGQVSVDYMNALNALLNASIARAKAGAR